MVARLDEDSVKAMGRTREQLQGLDQRDPRFASNINDFINRLSGARRDLTRRFVSPIRLDELSIIESFLRGVVEFLSVRPVRQAFANAPLSHEKLEDHGYRLFRLVRRYELAAEHYYRSGKPARDQRRYSEALKDLDEFTETSEQFKRDVDTFLRDIHTEFLRLVN
jgi:hypothetical protein